jgi:[ribosomal protein S18]-alanine N-acetyltransferase
MTGGFGLRRLGALDLDLASSLHGLAFAPLGERVWTRQDMAELLASPGAAGWVLLSAERPAGFALCRVAADEAELLTIAVHPDERRRGAGRALLTAAIDHARVAGAHSLFLEVGADNPAALALYGTAGLQAVGRRKSYYQRGERPPADAVVMRLSLISGGLTSGG